MDSALYYLGSWSAPEQLVPWRLHLTEQGSDEPTGMVSQQILIYLLITPHQREHIRVPGKGDAL